LLIVRAGLPAPVAQFRITDADGLVARWTWPIRS